jgi:hypothetical protein
MAGFRGDARDMRSYGRIMKITAKITAGTFLLFASTGIALAGAGGASADPYCSPSVGCAGNDENGNPIEPKSVAPDTSTFPGRASCAGGLAMSALGPGGAAAAAGAGLSLLGCAA